MEMQEVPAKAETEDKGKEKEKEKEKEKRAEEPKLEVKTEEEAGREHYSTLMSPSEEVYAEAFHTVKPYQELPGNTRLYRAVCVCLSVICLLLLVAVVILGLKLQAGSAACSVCNEKLCLEYIRNTRAACEKCPKGWVWYRNHCYFLSTLRLTWEKSQANCTSIGGSLAVITDKEVQNFLTDKGNLNYWIGLKRDQSAWSWVDNQGVVKSFWRSNPGDGDCVLLYSREPAEKNWAKTTCQAGSYYICQMAF